MSYAAVAAKNAPPEEEQVQPSQAYLDGGFKGDTHTGLPDVDEKLAVVDQAWVEHPETSTSLHETSSHIPPVIPHNPAPAPEPSVSSVAPTPLEAPDAPKTSDPIPSEQVERLKKAAEEEVEEVEEKAGELKDKAKKEGKKLEKEAKELASKAKAEAKELSKKAKAELEEAETVLAKYYEKSKDIVLRPGVLGGILGVVNIGLLSTAGYFAYTRKDQPWDRRIIAGSIIGSIGLIGAEGVVAEKYIDTEEGRAEAKRAKAEGSKLYRQAKETVLRPSIAGGLVGAFNVAVLSTVGYYSYKNWNAPVWDRRVISAVTVGLIGLSGLEGYAANYYKENELPKRK